ncbi:MAG: hypothetical protein JO352_30565 [Chloroflexi bacterium]|nr:hypothetical protein [Chloroflexota bacterium]
MSARTSRPVATFVSYRAATPNGDGGNHRTYQILRDLQAEFGCDGVVHVALEEWATRRESWRDTTPSAIGRLQSLPRRLRQRVERMTENPYNLLTRHGWSRHSEFGTRGVLPRQFCDRYVDRVLRRGATISLVDHPLFDQIRDLNLRAAVPTIIASHNLESLDVARVPFASRVATQRSGVDFANELWSLSRFEGRLAISRIEAAVLNGVGLSCQFYPYLPTGDVRAQLLRSANERRRSEQDPNLFLLMGTSFHAPTRRSMQWFVAHAAKGGLPRKARVVLVGSHVEELAVAGCRVPGLEVRGRVSNAELGELLVRAGTALVPQRLGFGALTRIPELACAGVPSLVFPHASYALDPPPGAQVLGDDSWASLVGGMCRAMGSPVTIEAEAYSEWEARQERPLGQTLRRIMDG